jgi:hypothetical protein
LAGSRNREGVGNLVSGDKTLLESPEPGASGRPMNRRRPGEDGDLDTGYPGAMEGTNRSVKLTNKKRKNRAA